MTFTQSAKAQSRNEVCAERLQKKVGIWKTLRRKKGLKLSAEEKRWQNQGGRKGKQSVAMPRCDCHWLWFCPWGVRWWKVNGHGFWWGLQRPLISTFCFLAVVWWNCLISLLKGRYSQRDRAGESWGTAGTPVGWSLHEQGKIMKRENMSQIFLSEFKLSSMFYVYSSAT